MKSHYLIFWLLTLYTSVLTAQSSFKVVGYLPDYRKNITIDYEKFTHLCLAFANPSNSTGTLTHDFTNLSTIVTNAHNKEVKVLISIGGGNMSTTRENNYLSLMKAENRGAFITKLLNFVKDNNLDGLDVDLEGDLVSSDDYNDFVITLSDSIKKRNASWLLTAAYTTYNADYVSDKAIAQFDFINSMSYDACGPTWGTKGCNHSPFSRAEYDQDYWVNERNIDKSRFILGVPFYGMDWISNTYVSYADVLKNYPNDIENDEANDGNVNYNGKKTIQKKTQFAMENGGGIMIWEIGQDAIGNKDALLNVIHEEVLLPITKKQAALVTLYPNPVSNQLECQLLTDELAEVVITNLVGQEVYKKTMNGKELIDVSSFEEGIYIVHILSENKQQTQKIRVVKG